jgi:hypothetical protein
MFYDVVKHIYRNRYKYENHFLPSSTGGKMIVAFSGHDSISQDN